jgi:chromosome segregation ATPase
MPESLLVTGRLELKLAELERRLEERTRELELESLKRQDIEERAGKLAGDLKGLEEMAGRFERDGTQSAALLEETAQTLKAADQARTQVVEALERQGAELSRWRKEGGEQKARADALEKKLGQTQATLADLEALTGELRRMAAEREKLIEGAEREMRSAEEVRREGIEALEKARELQKKPKAP